jgi:hypothetical protein
MPRDEFGLRAEVAEEALKKAFEKGVAHQGMALCRFCKGSLDLTADFCEQCGAPVAEAMPPGSVRPQPLAVAPVNVPPQPAPASKAQLRRMPARLNCQRRPSVRNPQLFPRLPLPNLPPWQRHFPPHKRHHAQPATRPPPLKPNRDLSAAFEMR